jgi:DNA-binding transcriptional LysR family regulator
MDRLDAMEMFVRIVETGSLSAVARELNTTQPTVSKQLTALERRLNTRLLHRSTRKLNLTESGASYYESCKRIVDQVREAEGTLNVLQTSLTGHLHVNTSIAFGELFMTGWVLDFQRTHPDLQIELSLNDRFVDLVEQGVDVAVRIGKLIDSSLIARRLGQTRRIAIATPAYLAKHGCPKTPHDLVHHNCLMYSYLSTGNEWAFRGKDGEIRVKVSGNFKSNNGHALREALLANVGVAVTPDFLASDVLRDGTVRAILPEYEPMPFDINAVYLSNRMVSTKVRAFVDYMQREFRELPALFEAA